MNRAIDFGGSTAKDLSRLIPRLVFGGVIAAFAVGMLWELAWQHQQVVQSTADTQLAAIVGPPCPATREAFDRAIKVQGPLPYVFEYNGVTFGRYFGIADCSVAASKTGLGLDSYDVCQFTGPSTLYVKTPRGEFYFSPGVGHKASVMTEGGVARCVMAAPAEVD
jgi:hypothetical protein